jgi:hypothetical protein
MAQQNIESTDNLNEGREKINENFTELYETPLRSGELTDDVQITGQQVIFFGTVSSRIAGLLSFIADPTESARQVNVNYFANSFSQGLQVYAQSFGDSATLNFTPNGLLISKSGVDYIAVPANGTEGQILKWISGSPQWVTEGGGGG